MLLILKIALAILLVKAILFVVGGLLRHARW